MNWMFSYIECIVGQSGQDLIRLLNTSILHYNARPECNK